MSVTNRIRWEVQLHRASGARIHRVVITSRGARRLLFALGIAGWVVLAGGLLIGFQGFLTRLAVAAARSENNALRAEQRALREQTLELAVRVFEDVERGRRLARLGDTSGRAWNGQNLRLAARDAGDTAVLAWLSEQGVRLEAFGNEVTTGRVEIGAKQASLPAPVPTGPVPNTAAVQLADLGSATRQEAAPARR